MEDQTKLIDEDDGYTDEDIQLGEEVEDFLPSPEEFKRKSIEKESLSSLKPRKEKL